MRIVATPSDGSPARDHIDQSALPGRAPLAAVLTERRTGALAALGCAAVIACAAAAGCGSPTYSRNGITGTGGDIGLGSGGVLGSGGTVAGSGGKNGSGGTPASGGAIPEATGGKGSGGAASGGALATGGASTGGAASGGRGSGGAGTGGASTGGGTAGAGGAATGGRGSGGAGTGGAATGGAATGGASTGGASVDTAHYNFETSTQSWGMPSGTSAFTSITRNTSRHFAGAASLAGAIAATGASSYQLQVAPDTAIAGGKVVTAHVYIPAGATIDSVQLYVQEGAPNYAWTGTAVPYTAAAWTTLMVTAPPSGGAIAGLGVEFHLASAWTGTVYVDSVNW